MGNFIKLVSLLLAIDSVFLNCFFIKKFVPQRIVVDTIFDQELKSIVFFKFTKKSELTFMVDDSILL